MMALPEGGGSYGIVPEGDCMRIFPHGAGMECTLPVARASIAPAVDIIGPAQWAF